jgi:hypothetical protein
LNSSVSDLSSLRTASQKLIFHYKTGAKKSPLKQKLHQSQQKNVVVSTGCCIVLKKTDS